MIALDQSSRYELELSPLYRLGRTKDLAALLRWRGNPSQLKAFSKRDDHFDEYDQVDPKTLKKRHIEAPKAGLKRLQRRLNALLQRIHAPPYLHSGIRGRSYLTHAGTHTQAEGATLTADISDYYPSVSTERLQQLFRKDFRCSIDVAWILARLLSCRGHLATGSPASAIVAFMANRSIFDELAKRATKRGIAFSLYMDDLAFTGRGVNRSDAAAAGELLIRHGLRIKAKKTRLFHADQPKLVTGVAWRNGIKRAPNAQHKLMREALLVLQRAPREPGHYRTAIGRVQHIAMLDDVRGPQLRKKARELRVGLKALESPR
ncbi:reverse transcriptase family protein [Luteimonas sp. FCS-9]|uniref:reverse transcriptase family protein n=1 Tax=Luteimonas sp. FCS-9 TaxID=1547516 RepID=UPI000AB4884E|nr:reverse transcriptase family protein [Luteimonas sp. FCS-9]